MVFSLLAQPRPATSQPAGVPEIDWSNPIAQGLLGVFLPTVPINLVDGVPLTTSGSFAVGAAGFGASVSGGAIGYPAVSSSSAPEAKLDQQVFSALAVCQQTAGENADWYALFRGAGSAYPPWGVGLHSGSLNGPAICYGSYRGLSGAGPVVDLGAGWTLKPRVVLLLANAGAWACWSEGFKAGSGTTTAPSFQYTSSGGDRRVMLAAMNGTGASLKLRSGLGLYWGRVLSDAEAASITANPWQIFRDVQAVPFSAAAGGTDTPLTLAAASQAQASTSPTLTAAAALAVAASDQAQTSTQPALTAAVALTTQNSAQAQAATSPVLFTEITLSPQAAAQVQAAGNLVLSSASTLALQSAAQAQAPTSPTLTTAGSVSLVLQGAAQAQGSDNVVLLSGLSLVVADAGQAQASSTFALAAASALTVATAAQGQSADSPTLSAHSTLVLASASQGQQADNVVLDATPRLNVADAGQAQTSTSASLTSASTLTVHNASQLQTADNAGGAPTLGLAGGGGPDDSDDAEKHLSKARKAGKRLYTPVVPAKVELPAVTPVAQPAPAAPTPTAESPPAPSAPLGAGLADLSPVRAPAPKKVAALLRAPAPRPEPVAAFDEDEEEAELILSLLLEVA